MSPHSVTAVLSSPQLGALELHSGPWHVLMSIPDKTYPELHVYVAVLPVANPVT